MQGARSATRGKDAEAIGPNRRGWRISIALRPMRTGSHSTLLPRAPVSLRQRRGEVRRLARLLLVACSNGLVVPLPRHPPADGGVVAERGARPLEGVAVRHRHIRYDDTNRLG